MKLLQETGLFVLREGDLPQVMIIENYHYFNNFVYGLKNVTTDHINLSRREEPVPGRPLERI